MGFNVSHNAEAKPNTEGKQGKESGRGNHGINGKRRGKGGENLKQRGKKEVNGVKWGVEERGKGKREREKREGKLG